MQPGLASKAPLRIALVTKAAGAGTRAAPYGAATVISALAAQADFSGKIISTIITALPQETPETTAARVLAWEPQLVGFSVYSWNRGFLSSVASLLRKGRATPLFVAGGPETSADPEGILAEGLGDLAVSGEGEAAMAAIVASMLKVYSEGGSVTSLRDLPGQDTILRPPLLELSGLVSPWLDGTLDPAQWGGAALELARGCPFRCAFCFESKGYSDAEKGKPRVRRFPLTRMAAELDRFKDAGIEEVFVLDPTFNADSKRMAEAIGIMATRGRGLRFVLELRAELLDRKQAKLLAGLNCSVQIGLQSSDPAVLAGVDRFFDPLSFASKIRLLEEYGTVYGLDLIFGLPGDTLAGFCRSLDYALALKPNHLDIFRLAVLPGTALADRAASLGLSYEPLAPHLVRSTPGFPAMDLDRAETLAWTTDLLYNRGRAVIWFATLTKALGMKPSALIRAFADSAQARNLGSAQGLSHRDIESASLDFINRLFEDRAGLKVGAKTAAQAAGLAKAGTQLIRVSGAWTRALAEEESTELELDWNPQELLEYAAADLRRFTAEFNSRPGRWVCAPGREGPRFSRLRTQKH